MSNRIDFTFLKESIGDDENTFKEMLAIFDDSAKEFIKNLDQAFLKNDAASSAKVAHKFAPSCAILGLNEIFSLVKEIENHAADENEVSSLKNKKNRIEDLLIPVFNEIEILLK